MRGAYRTMRDTPAPDIALAALIGVLFRVFFDESHKYLTEAYLDRFYPAVMERLIAEKSWTYFLLPVLEFKGTWATTGFIPVYFLEEGLGPNSAYLVLSALATVSFGFACWMLTKRRICAFVASLALALSPFNYHVYLVNGSNNVYPLIVFLSLCCAAYAMYVRNGGIAAFLAGTMLLVATALSYEIWLNAAAVYLLAVPLCWYFLCRLGKQVEARRLVFIAVAVIAVALAYTVVRGLTLTHTAVPSSEFQFVFSHASASAIVDDLVFHAVFLFYLTLVQLFPGPIGTSLTIFSSGALDTSKLQSGYLPDLYPIVDNHYLNMWMIYAGALFALSLIYGILFLRRAFEKSYVCYFVSGLIILGVTAGAPTYVLLKFIPLNVVPLLSYKATIGLLILLFGLGLIVDWIGSRWKVRARVGLLAAVVTWVALVAFSRPVWMNETVLAIWGEVGFYDTGFYPDPWARARSLILG